MTGVLPWSAPLWRPEVVEKEAEKVVADHDHTHGVWDQQSSVARDLKDVVEAAQAERLYQDRLTQGQREAIDMMLVKISRILCGNPNHPDHILDIIGYAKLFQRSGSSE